MERLWDDLATTNWLQRIGCDEHVLRLVLVLGFGRDVGYVGMFRYDLEHRKSFVTRRQHNVDVATKEIHTHFHTSSMHCSVSSSTRSATSSAVEPHAGQIDSPDIDAQMSAYCFKITGLHSNCLKGSRPPICLLSRNPTNRQSLSATLTFNSSTISACFGACNSLCADGQVRRLLSDFNHQINFQVQYRAID